MSGTYGLIITWDCFSSFIMEFRFKMQCPQNLDGVSLFSFQHSLLLPDTNQTKCKLLTFIPLYEIIFFHLVTFRIISLVFPCILKILDYFPIYLTYNGCFQYIICAIMISGNALEISLSLLSPFLFLLVKLL